MSQGAVHTQAHAARDKSDVDASDVKAMKTACKTIRAEAQFFLHGIDDSLAKPPHLEQIETLIESVLYHLVVGDSSVFV